MVADYIKIVVLYFLFGYLFIPDEICATGVYILGAFAFPFVVDHNILRSIVKTIAQKMGHSKRREESIVQREESEQEREATKSGELIFPGQLPLPGFEDMIANTEEAPTTETDLAKRMDTIRRQDKNRSVHNLLSAERQESKSPQRKRIRESKNYRVSQFMFYDREFEYRLIRARTEPMRIVEYLDTDHSLAIVINESNSHTYKVGEFSCECMDYEKRRKPCKHMIFLALQTNRFQHYELSSTDRVHSGENEDGEFVPLYWNYYIGYPTGLGYTNLYRYQVEGRIYGTSPKTGKPTNKKKTIMVNAKDKEDALQAAEEAGIMPPYACVQFLDACPSEAQYNYLHGAGIPIPYFINTADASALLTRYEDRDNEICPGYLFEMATKYRAEVSYFQSPASVKSCIWASQPREKKPAMFCYAVYCKKRGYDFGAAQTKYDDPIFAGFQPTEREKAYIEGIVEFGWIPLRTNTNAYKSAVAYLAEQRLV